MECKNCKNIISDKSTFCRHCGKPVLVELKKENKACKKCGHENLLTAQFCSRCGVLFMESKNRTKMFLFGTLILLILGMILGLIAAKENFDYKSILPKTESTWEQPSEK